MFYFLPPGHLGGFAGSGAAVGDGRIADSEAGDGAGAFGQLEQLTQGWVALDGLDEEANEADA